MSDFWKMSEVTPDMIVKESRDYLIIAAPTLWREQGRETSRDTGNYAILNKQFHVVEAWANNLPLAHQILDQVQGQLTKIKDEQDAKVVSMFPKNNAE